MKKKIIINLKVFDVINLLFIIPLLMIMILPLINAFAVSFSSNLASMDPGIAIWPKDISIEGYKTVIKRLEFWRPFMNSVIVTAVGTFIHVMLATYAGYVLIQEKLPFKNIMLTIILLTMMIPSQAIMVPQYIIFKELQLTNKLVSLVVSGLVSGFSVLLMKNYFLSVPYSLYESAVLDGANDFKIIWNIYLPSAKAGLMTVGLFEFVSRWNDFTSPLLYINNSKLYTLPLALRSIILPDDSTSTADLLTNNVKMAGVVISLVPLLIIYPFVQRYFIKGVNLGALKE